MVRAIVAEEGPEAMVERLGDPVWFQSLGTVLAFDWNASGLTTILTAALKEAIRGEERDLGIFICGGKGKTSLKTPEEITNWGRRGVIGESRAETLAYNSRLTAKVDSALVQDGFSLYHHSFFFTRSGAWTVVQQGMNKEAGSARRYHWHSKFVSDLVCEPHSGIASETQERKVMNLVAKSSEKTRTMSGDLVLQNFASLLKDINLLRKYKTPVSRMVKFKNRHGNQLTLLELDDAEFNRHPVINEDFSKSKYLEKILLRVCEEKPQSYERLLATPGVGAKTMRALALVAEVIYGAAPSYEDPARYSFAHGGKDATPYPVDKRTYDATIETLRRYAARAKKSESMVRI